MTNKVILVDVDGCLLNWLDRFVDYMHSEGYTTYLDDPDQYNLESFFDVPAEDVYKRITTFNDDHWKFGTLDTYKGTKEAMSLLVDLGYRFVAITSCSDKESVADLRRANLYNIFGDVFDKVHCIALHKDKGPILRQYEPTFWIEDRFSHAIEGAIAGHTAILIDRPWNQDEYEALVTRCHSWAEIVQYIIEVDALL